MGYQTMFMLSTDDIFNDRKYRAELEYMSGYGEPLFIEEQSWDDYEEHMRMLSKMYPKVLFTLYGWGEDRDDVWAGYAKGGKYYEVAAKIVYPAFDEGLLE